MKFAILTKLNISLTVDISTGPLEIVLELLSIVLISSIIDLLVTIFILSDSIPVSKYN
jgi:hypothetical protein